MKIECDCGRTYEVRAPRGLRSTHDSGAATDLRPLQWTAGLTNIMTSTADLAAGRTIAEHLREQATIGGLDGEADDQ